MEEAAAAAQQTPVIVLRVVVNAPDLDAFITRYSKHLLGDRIFIFTKTPQAIGTRVKFSLFLKSGEPLIVGKGTVTRIQKDQSDARHPPGMELVFVTLDERSQTLVDFMHATRQGAVEAPVAPVARVILPPKPSLMPRTASPAELPPLTPEKSRVVVVPLRSEGGPPVVLMPPPIPGDATSPPLASSEIIGEQAHSDPKIDIRPALLRAATSTLFGDSQEVRVPELAGGKAAVAHLEAPKAAADVEPANGHGPAHNIPARLAEVLGTPGDPEELAPGPAPAMVERWREPLAPGAPAVAPEGVPANPFSEVSDGAIDYFVEWSIEQSIGPHREPSTHFSNVSMSMPAVTDDVAAARGSGEDTADIPLPERPAWLMLAAGIGIGAPLGGLLVWALSSHHPAPQTPAPVAAATAPAPAPAPPPTPEPPAPVAEPVAERGTLARAPKDPATADPILWIVTRPSIATVTVDGKPMGQTPLKLELPSGPHEVTIAKDRYATITQTAKSPGRIDLDLRRPSLALQITSTPPAAQITIAGIPRGKSPLTVKLPGYEKYDVQVSLPNSEPWRRAVYLKGATTLSATLSPKRPPTKSPKR